MFKFTLLAALLVGASAFVVPGGMGPRTRSVKVNEDFGLFGFEKEWKDSSAVLSEAELEKLLNKDGLRYRMNRTEKESEGLADIGPTLKLGPLELKPPKVESIWEALGFTATGTNEASLKAKEEWKKGLKNNTYKFARFSKEEKDEWRQKYGYDRAYGEQ
mmetsp:Transcript_17831/g.67688  ORF Transcript_17831/g.67688 Transcript_17831/m.67688 type:complete len:160 (-) Transcript_17831:130-609(-)